MVRIRTTEFTRLQNPALCTSAQENVDAVVANVTLAAEIFPGPELVQTALDTLFDANTDAEHGTPAEKNFRDQSRVVLISYLQQWVGFFLQKGAALTTEQAQIEFYENYAWVPTSKGSAIGHLTAVENPRVKARSKALLVQWKKKKGAYSYRLMKTLGFATAESIWVEETITGRCRVTVPSPAGQVVSFVIYPIGSAGIGDESEFISGMAGL